MGKLSDEALIAAHNNADDDRYFTELLGRYSKMVYGRCVNMLRDADDAEDAAQVIWTKVYFALPDFQKKARFKTWLYSIVNNHCLNVVRGRKALMMSFDEQIDSETRDADDALKQLSAKMDLSFLLNTVSKIEKALLIMKYIDKYSYDEIARKCNMSVSAAKMRIARAKERIKTYAKQPWR